MTPSMCRHGVYIRQLLLGMRCGQCRLADWEELLAQIKREAVR